MTALQPCRAPANVGRLGQSGALLLPNGAVRFRIWAPDVMQLHLVLEECKPVPMVAVEGGFYELTVPCEAGARYRYRLPSGQMVPDPASRQQEDDVHGASVVIDMQAYPWEHNDWSGRTWEHVVLYEVHCGLAGGFTRLMESLPQLAQLGVTAIELMPVADFPGERNWGYDGVLPYAPDASYGRPDDLKRLIDAAHGLGLMVFLDVVYNHFGPEGNYLPLYASGFFRHDVDTPWGAAIDFREPAVRSYFSENALHWLRDYRFDGLRIDAVHAMWDCGWLTEMAAFVRERIEPDRRIHLVVENDKNCATLLRSGFDAQWNDDAHHVVHHLLTGERQGYYLDYADDPAGKLAKSLSEGFIYQGEASRWRPDMKRGEPSSGLPPTAFVFFLQNHDQTGNRALGERLAALCEEEPKLLKAAVALQLLSPHIPMLFMGEEYGLKTPFHYFVDFGDAALATAAREGRKREFEAFEAVAGNQLRSCPDPTDVQAWELSRPGSAPIDPAWARCWFSYYRDLLALRARHISPYLKDARSRGAGALAPRVVKAEWILGNGAVLTIYINLGPEEYTCEPELEVRLERPELLFESCGDAGAELAKGRLPPFCTVVLLRTDADFCARRRHEK